MSKTTHTNHLPRQDVEELRRNPYVKEANSCTVTFTEDFKKLAYEQKCLGVPVAETMETCGIDPKVLGVSRVKGFAYTLGKYARQGRGFADRRTGTWQRQQRDEEENTSERLQRLERELAHIRQEVAFLKRLQKVGRDANVPAGVLAPEEQKYNLIREAIGASGNLLSLTALCGMAEVSRTDYYAWLSAREAAS